MQPNRQTIQRLTTRTCAGWLLKRVATSPLLFRHSKESHQFLRTGGGARPQFCACLGAAFPWDALVYFAAVPATSAAGDDAAKSALESAQKLEPDSPETLLALGYYQYWVLSDYGLPKPPLIASVKCCPATAMPYLVSAELAGARDTGIKALPTWNEPSLWTRVTCSYYGAAWTYACFDNSLRR